MKPRFIVECTWSGYTSSQRRICHRTVERNFIDAYRGIRAIRFNDGTEMTITVRICKPREKVPEIHGYTRLLHAAAMQGLSGSPSADEIHL